MTFVSTENDTFRKRISSETHCTTLREHCWSSKKITVNHFLEERIPRPTIYRIIKKFEESGVIGDKPRNGRPDKLLKQQLTRLKCLTDQKTGISLRKLPPKFDVDISRISRHLKAIDITYREKENGHLNTPTNNLKRSQHVLDDCT